MATTSKKAAPKRSKTTTGYLRVQTVNGVLDRQIAEARRRIVQHEAYGAETSVYAWRGRLAGLESVQAALDGKAVGTRR